MKKILIILALVAIGIAAAIYISHRSKTTENSAGETTETTEEKAESKETTGPRFAVITTDKGTIKAELYTDATPGTVANFMDLAEAGFYDGLTFHRVIPGFVIQGGCPEGTGAGGPGYTIKCETDAPKQYHDRGVLSMAHRGKDTGGSQFFICLSRESTAHLDGVHTAFGKVVDGIEVIDLIEQGDHIKEIKIVGE